MAQAPGAGFAGAYLAARQASFASDYKAAADYYTRALSRDRGNPMLQESAVLAFVGLGKIDSAAPIARQMRADGLKSQMANLVVMGQKLKDGDYAGAVEGIDNGDLPVGPLVDGLAKGWALMGEGQADQAMEAFDQAIETTGLAAFGLYHKALALALAGDFEAAETIFSGEGGAPLRLTRRGAFAHAEVLSQLGRNDDAVQLIEAGWGQDMDPGLALLVDRLKAGERVPFTQVRNVQDGEAEVFYTVAGALQGEAADSYTLLYARMAEYLNPGHVDAILLSARLLETQGQFDLAIDAYDQVPADDPGFYVAQIGRAAALRDAGQSDKAIEVLQELATTHPDMSVVQITLGDNLRRDERFAEAASAYDKAIALFTEESPSQWVVYYARGISHEREKQWDLAEADLRKALELNPGQPQVLNYLGYSYVEKDENLDQALDMIEQAVEAEPDSGYITDSLGWAFYRMGRYPEAVDQLERAAELMATDPVVNDHLGDAYWAVGRKVEAQFQWRRAMSFDPEPEEADRIRRKLQVGLDVVLEEEGAEPLSMVNDDG
ncbi:tetratricopeptide repeat protein [Tropicimonas sp. IMCC34043]|uniref:tetratricopeptide repeat protein n=1 Tax=Tropicimonas sp. IMCC34043 TaxID=2248760 RepID=UPI000E259115|nr:tetratricopeptide repeat protein [Tropicimonas sp. IMCC34043]